MKKAVLLIIYSLLLLFIGRNLFFLPKLAFLATPQPNTVELKKDVEKLLKGKEGNYSVYYLRIDTDTPQTFGIQEDEVFTAGSINKVPIVATLYALARDGKINLDDQVIVQKDDIEDYGTGSLRYGGVGKAYTLKQLAKLAISQSDNTAAKMLAVRLTLPMIQQHVDGWGMTQTNMINNKTSTKDISLLFEKLYKGEVASPALTKELLGFFKDTEFEDRIPLYLPKEATVYHKTGDVIGGIHDAGIIKGEKGQVFIISVLTSNIGSGETKTKQTIGEVAKLIYDYNKERD